MVDKRAGILPQQVVGGQYNAPGVTLDDGEQTPLQVTADGRLKTDIDGSDIEIGAVEIKDGASDQRAKVLAPSTPAVATDPALVVDLNPGGPAVVALGVKVTAVTALETGGVGIIGWLSQVWRALGNPTDAKSTATDTTAISAMSVWKQISASVQALVTNLGAVVGVTPQFASGGNVSLQSNATGTTFNAFASQACKQLTVVNNTGVDVEVLQAGAGVALPVFNGTAYTFQGLANASDLGYRRIDTSNTQVTLTARWEA